MLKGISLLFIYLFCLSSELLFALVEVSSTVQPRLVPLNGKFNLTVKIKYDSENKIQLPQLPKWDIFYLLGQHQSSHIQYINSQVSKKKEYHYILKAIKEGVFTIGPIQVVIDGKVYKTSEIKVEVSSKFKPKSKPQVSLFPFGGFGGFQQILPPSFFSNNSNNKFSQDVLEQILFKLEIKESPVYVGEMLLAKWFFYLPSNLVSDIQSEIIEESKLDGFWAEFIPQKRGNIKPKKIINFKGKKYKKRLFYSAALFPVRTGTLNIGTMKVRNYVFGRSAFFDSSKVFIKNSHKKILKVLPLPKKGKGKFFTQAVGDFNISATVNKKEVLVNTPIIYKLHFSGRGDSRVIQIPNLNFGKFLKVYDITDSQNFSVSKSVKTFEVILIPKEAGDFIIPSFKLSTFDPQLGIYKTHIVASFKLKVTEDSAIVKITQTPKIKTSVEKLKPHLEANQKSKLSQSSKLQAWFKNLKIKELWFQNQYKIWFVICFVLLLLFIFIMKKCGCFKINKNFLKVLLKQNLKEVDQALKQKNWSKAGIALNHIIYLFFTELAGQDKIIKNWDTLFSLIHPSIRIKYESKIRSLISTLEILSFASVEEAQKWRNQSSVEDLKTELIQVLNKIDSEYSYLGVLGKRRKLKRQSKA